MIDSEDVNDIINYSPKSISLYDANQAGSTIQKCKINGVEMTIHEFRKSKTEKIGNIWHNKRLGVPVRD